MMRLSNPHFNQKVVQHRKMFLWNLRLLKRKLMIVIMKHSDQVAIKPRRSTRICTTPEWYGDHVLDIMLDNNEPTSYGEAMVGSYSDKWLEAMKSEIGSMYQNKVWTLVDFPDDWQAIEINGSLRRRQTWTVISPSMKLEL